jgi:hypothetical protein
LPLIIAACAAVCGALIAGPEAVDPYGRVYDPLVTLAWIGGWRERIGLGTSIVLVPPHKDAHGEGGRDAAGAPGASRSVSGWAGTDTSLSSWR